MRTLFIMTFAVNVVLSILSLLVLPSRVAIHFGPGGMADNWAPSSANALLFLGIHILLFCMVYFSPRLIFAFPPKWINLPNKDYWLTDANKGRANAMIGSLMWEFGAALFAFLFVVELLTIKANLSRPVKLNETVFLGALILFLLYTVYWCIKFFRSFRIHRELPSRRGNSSFSANRISSSEKESP
jgi:uncharacterized membrane protein